MIGSELVAQLRAGGAEVRAGLHSMDRTQAAASLTVALDLDDPATLPPVLDGVDALFVLGAMGPDQTRQELGAVTAAEAAGVRRVVKLSVWRAPDRLSPVAELHRPVEEALEASSLDWTFLRPNFFMQNFSRQMAGAIASGVIAQPQTTAPISFVDARDVARCAAAVLTGDGHGGRVYDLTGPDALTYDQVAERLSVALQRTVRFVGLTDEQARAAMSERGLPRFQVEALIGVSRAYREGGAEAVTSTVARLTGREPTSLAQFIEDHRGAFGA